MILLVTYDLKVPGRDYQKLYEVLKSAPEWWHFLESTWILFTRETATAWREKIKATLDDNDRLLIVDITQRSRDGWLPKQAWDWLREKEAQQ